METINRARALPIFRMGETDFYIDTRLGEFRQVDAPENRISMNELRGMEDNQTELAFNMLTKNIYEDILHPEHIPAHVKLVIIPPLKELDPVGMARKLGLPDNWFKKAQPQQVHRRSKRKGYRL